MKGIVRPAFQWLFVRLWACLFMVFACDWLLRVWQDPARAVQPSAWFFFSILGVHSTFALQDILLDYSVNKKQARVWGRKLMIVVMGVCVLIAMMPKGHAL